MENRREIILVGIWGLWATYALDVPIPTLVPISKVNHFLYETVPKGLVINYGVGVGPTKREAGGQMQLYRFWTCNFPIIYNIVVTKLAH